MNTTSATDKQPARIPDCAVLQIFVTTMEAWYQIWLTEDGLFGLAGLSVQSRVIMAQQQGQGHVQIQRPDTEGLTVWGPRRVTKFARM